MEEPLEVWLIEDDPISALIIKKVLAKDPRIGSVLHFPHGQAAWEQLRDLHPQVHPQLILLDINMPVMDGWEFLELLAQVFKPCGLQVAMLSSSISPEDKAKSQLYPCVRAYVAKPISAEKIADLLAKLKAY